MFIPHCMPNCLCLCLELGCIFIHEMLPTGKYFDNFFHISGFRMGYPHNVTWILLLCLAVAVPGKASSVSGGGSPISPAEGPNSPAIPLSEAHILLQRGQSQQAGSEETAPPPTSLKHGKLWSTAPNREKCRWESELSAHQRHNWENHVPAKTLG